VSHTVPDDPRVTAALEEYLAALEAGPPPDRQAFLARHADVADALAGCLEGLDFLRRTAPEVRPLPAPPADAAFAGGDGPAVPLGDYRILREAGQGGMGIVYEAIQLSLGRRVALKVLPFAATMDPRRLQRFKNEAQAAAQLHHTNIVPIYAVGCERGVHYYAMQLIEGKTLAAVIAELRQGGAGAAEAAPTEPVAGLVTERSTPGPGFFRTAARLGVQAAEALEHAHQFGVIHRDVKPANLLVDAHGHLRVTDFGLALGPDDAGLSVTGELVGTLRYVSPEQASARRGLVDHRTDVYSLGATLYELLTLRPVFDAADRRELLRQIAEEEPLPPRRLRKDVPRELETIVLKALRKEVHERYATAGELADDLRRFLEDRPIQARRPTLPERLARWSRRHRSLVWTAAALLLVAVAALAVNHVLIVREQDRTRAAYDREAEARQRAEANFRQARTAVDSFSEVAIDLPDDPALQEVRRKLLEPSLRYYRDFIEQHQDDPVLHAELVASHYRVANILDEMGARAEAQAAYAQAREAERKRDVQPKPDPPAEDTRRTPAVLANGNGLSWGRFGPQQERLGVIVEKPAATLADQLDLPAGRGLVLREVRPLSPAALAGLRANDLLLELNDRPVPSDVAGFAALLGEIKANVPVAAVVLRRGKKETVEGLSLPEAPGHLAFGRTGLNLFVTGARVSMSGTADGGVTVTWQEGDLTVLMARGPTDARARVSEIQVKEGEQTRKYQSLDEVPAAVRPAAQNLVRKGEGIAARGP
jgi:eukaryotic-like serine/threonine-protein kinase